MFIHVVADVVSLSKNWYGKPIFGLFESGHLTQFYCMFKVQTVDNSSTEKFLGRDASPLKTSLGGLQQG